MGHTPHLYVPPPWDDHQLSLSASQVHHLETVLRRQVGEAVSYTDGVGTSGSGVFDHDAVARGSETYVDRLPELELAVAPPHERDRVRWLVEKAAELEITRICWLKTRFSNTRSTVFARAQSWSISALEQSRGSWLTQVDDDWMVPLELDERLPTVVAHPLGSRPTQALPLRVMVGPEGGWAPEDLDRNHPLVSLGRAILRTETAALVAAAWFRSQPSP